MRSARTLALILACALAGGVFAGSAQTNVPKPELLLYHPSAPLAYEVATIRPVVEGVVTRAPGFSSLNLLSVRRYIMNAYGAMYSAQVIGGPDWLDKDSYNIKGKVPDQIEAAQKDMRFEDRQNQTRAMEQSLLAERFHLKAHFETRVLPVYELVPAKGGLKIIEVPGPPERKFGDPLPPPPHPGGTLPPGSMMTMTNSNGLHTTTGRAVKVQSLASVISFSGATEVGDRPLVDHTGFTGYFDVKDLTWAPLGDASGANAPDAPSLTEALERQLGLKLVPAKDPIEVLVIDSIDRPTEN